MTQVTGNYQLLAIKETLQENLSSVQIERTLDDLIFNALEPLIQNSDFVEYTIVELLPHVFHNQLRKFSILEAEGVRDALFSFVMSDNTEEKTKLLRKQALERSVYFEALKEFETVAKEYIESVRLKMHNADVPTPAKKIREDFFVYQNLYETCQSSTYWLHYAFKFRSMIVEKFVKLAYVESVKMAADTNLNINKKELFRNLIITTFKAIDKYNSIKGPLANYVNIWFMEAKNNPKNAHEEGVAFQMSTSQRKKMLERGSIQTFTIELDEAIAESVEDLDQDVLGTMIETQEDVVLNNLTCRADVHKVFSLATGVRYTLTPDDLKWQRESCNV